MLYKLEDICTLITDGSHFSPEDEGIGYPMLSVKDMGDDDFDFGSCKHVGEAAYQKLVINGCKPLVNDVVVAKDGSYLKSAFPITEDRDIALLSSIAILRPMISVVDPTYLSYYLKSKEVYRTVSLNYITGTALKRVILKGIKKIPIVLPELHEQQYRADLLKKLNRIMNSRKQELKMMNDLIKARFVEMFGDLRINPKGWDLKKLEELTVLITDGEHATPRRVDNGIYLLSARNVLNHRIQLDDVDYIDQDEYDRISKRVIPTGGDVLISCSGTVGRCCSVPEGLKFQMVRSAALLRFKPEIKPIFAEYMITSDFIQEQITQSKTASSQANLFQGKIANLKGFVPPTELQNQFAAFVAQVDKSKLQKISKR